MADSDWRQAVTTQLATMAKTEGYAGYNIDNEIPDVIKNRSKHATFSRDYRKFIRELAVALDAAPVDPAWKLSVDICGCGGDFPLRQNVEDLMGIIPDQLRADGEELGFDALTMCTYDGNFSDTTPENSTLPNGTVVTHNVSVQIERLKCLQKQYGNVGRIGLEEPNNNSITEFKRQLEVVKANNFNKLALWSGPLFYSNPEIMAILADWTRSLQPE